MLLSGMPFIRVFLLMENEIVKKSDILIRSRMSFTKAEQDIITLIVNHIRKLDDVNYHRSQKGQEPKDIPTEFRFKTAELFAHFNMSDRALYDYLDRGTDKIMHRVAYVKQPKYKKFRKHNFVSVAELSGGELYLVITEVLKDICLDFSAGFSEINLDILLNLKSAYGSRIFEMINRFKSDNKNPYFCTTLGEFEKITGTNRFAINDDGTQKYGKFSNYKKDVIDKPIAEIINGSEGRWIACGVLSKGKNPTPVAVEIEKIGREYKEHSKMRFTMRYVDPTIIESKTETVKPTVTGTWIDIPTDMHVIPENIPFKDWMIISGCAAHICSGKTVDDESLGEFWNACERNNYSPPIDVQLKVIAATPIHLQPKKLSMSDVTAKLAEATSSPKHKPPKKTQKTKPKPSEVELIEIEALESEILNDFKSSAVDRYMAAKKGLEHPIPDNVNEAIRR